MKVKSQTGNRGERKRERFLVNEVVKINIYRPLRGPQETYLPNIVEGRNGCKCFSFLLFFFFFLPTVGLDIQLSD